MSTRILAGVATIFIAAIMVAQEGPVLRRPAQNTEQKPTVSSEVRLVNVPFIARDKKGKLVNLNKDDLRVTDDGQPQTIKGLVQESDRSLTLGLLVDTSFAQRSSLDKERAASKALVDQLLREGKDQAFLIHFDRQVELLQDLTSSRTKLRDAIDKLETANRSARGEDDDRTGGQQSPGGYPGGGYPGGQGQGRRGGQSHIFHGTTLNDAVFLASDELLAKPEGRKVLIVLSDGMDHASKVSLERALESAQNHDVLVYTVYFEGQAPQENDRMNGGYPGGRGRYPGGGYPGGYPGGGYPGGGYPGGGYPGDDGNRQDPRQMREEGKKNLQRIAKETGGRYFEFGKKQSVEQIYGDIQEELRNQYSLTYTPDHPSVGYHKIAVTAVPKDVTVQAREGYYVK